VRFLDSNIIIDLLGDEKAPEADWSLARFGEAVAQGPVVCDHIVLAEVAAHAADRPFLLPQLSAMEIDIVALSHDASLRAGQAFREYRRRGGARTAILADFLIGAHAAVLGATLVTRDRRFASYFPDLTLITPETDHG